MSASLLCLLPALGSLMPPVELDARRLILVRSPSAADVPLIAAHVSRFHKDDVRYMMAASMPECVTVLDRMVELMQPDRLGPLATSQSTALLGVGEEPLDDAGWRIMETRDYVLRGTADGSASVLVGDESIIELLLLRAADLEADFDELPRGKDSVPAVSVLDFSGLPGVSFPWSVAEESPIVQPKWDVGDEWGS